MSAKPELKPLKGWKYRLILCDDEGNITFDDYGYEAMVHAAVPLLFKDLAEVEARNLAMKAKKGRL